MPREIIRTMYSADRQSRVCVFHRDDGTFGFSEERFSDTPLEQGWIRAGCHTASYCSSEDIVLRESIERVPWLAEMVARFEEIDGLADREATGSPPNPLDGALVICYSPLDQRHRHTGNCRHGLVPGSVSGLAICQFPTEPGCYYLFSCDADWQVISDTWHQTLEEAKRQAEFEYTGVSATWQHQA